MSAISGSAAAASKLSAPESISVSTPSPPYLTVWPVISENIFLQGMSFRPSSSCRENFVAAFTMRQAAGRRGAGLRKMVGDGQTGPPRDTHGARLILRIEAHAVRRA